MIPTPTAARNLRLLLAGLLAVVLATGCAGPPRPVDPGDGPVLIERDEGLAGRLYVQLQDEAAAGNHRSCLRQAYELLDHHPDFEHLDHVSLLAARSARSLGDVDTALRLSGNAVAERPEAPAAAELWAMRADIFAERRDWPRAADALVSLHDATVSVRDREEIVDRLAAAVGPLDADGVETLREAHPVSGVRPYLGYLWIEKLLAEQRGRDAQAAYSALGGDVGVGIWLGRAEDLLRGTPYEVAPAPPRTGDGVDADALHVGVLCPLTGRYTILGNAFYDGVRLAAEQANREGWRRYALSVRDSEGDPVAAAMAVRAYMQEERPIALIGGLRSAPTVAAALTAEGFGVPLVSPTATNDRIWELGDGVFQTNITQQFEAKLLADLAVEVMLKSRFAVLHPDEPAGLRSAQVFADEVVRLGGEMVALESFNVGLTDFRDPLQRLEKARPEVIFVPADSDVMRMLGPQLDYYRAGALILGPSGWNRPSLAHEIGGILERAVFPSDTALYPPAWTEHFRGEWRDEGLPPEATPIARQAYLAARLVFHGLGESGVESPGELSEVLATRLAVRDRVDLTPEALGAALRMYRGGAIVPFPMELYTDVLPVPEPEFDEGEEAGTP